MIHRSFLIAAVLWLSPIVTNLLHAQVIISEFMASNKSTLVDDFGNTPDWIEIYNTSFVPVNLLNWGLTDEEATPFKWRFPSTNLAAKGFMVIYASGTNRSIAGLPLHTSFSLKASGEYLALVRPDGSIATQFAPEFPSQDDDISYGTGQIVNTNVLVSRISPARFLVPANGSLGSSWQLTGFNDSLWSNAVAAVGYQTAVAGFAVRNFKANTLVGDLSTAEQVVTNVALQAGIVSQNDSMINYYGTGSEGHYGNSAVFPGQAVGVDVDDFVIEATATITIPVAGDYSFGVNSDDGFGLTVGTNTVSFAAPRGPSDTIGTFTFSAPGDYPLRLVYFERGGGAGLELFAASGSFVAWDSANFRLVGDTASGGLSVSSPVVSGGGAGNYQPEIGTDVQAALQGINSSLYLRVPFAVPDASALQSLSLRVKYDDGFVAYLNGQEVARRNAPATVQYNSVATSSRSSAAALVAEEINLSGALGALVSGANVLAIQALNESAADTDFLLSSELVEYEVTATNNVFFATPSPGALNNAGFFATVADTKFSHDRGFYETNFNLIITSATPGAIILYTTNGTVPSLTNGYTYTGPLPIGGTTVLRAAGFKDGYQPSNVDTLSYIFVRDVVRQSTNGVAPPGWPSSWGANVVDYGMDPDVLNNPLYASTITNDLKSIPSFSIVMNLNDLFDPTIGIYANSGQDGAAWERPTSAELIYPDGTKGFQIDAGIRIRGGFSRSTGNPKHAFRLFFRSEYGASKLVYPLFDDNGTDTFDAIDLRTFQNYSWSFQGDSRGIFVRDQFNRDSQLAMGHQGERGKFYHLYINGQYWGLYNTCERPEASFGATYFGGNADNFDVIKVEAGPYTINATDGNLDAWTQLFNLVRNGVTDDIVYQQIQGRNPDGSPNPAYPNLLDIDNLIDYQLMIIYGGNYDASISWFLSNNRPNNWYGMRDRTGTNGFRFFLHDSEHTMVNLDTNSAANVNRLGPFPAGGDQIQYSSPGWIWQKLTSHPEFRMRIADHVQRHFFNGGALTYAAATNRFLARKNEIDRAVVGESARWGDAKRATPFTRDVEWIAEINNLLINYFPVRGSNVVTQLKTAGLFPSLDAPVFNQHGGNVPDGFPLVMTSVAGVIYYTRDGSDPRLPGGGIAPGASVYSSPINLTESAVVKARAFDGTTWSAAIEAPFYIIRTFTDLLITEIMYNPPATALFGGDALEFIELKNASSSTRELSGIRFTNGIQFTFPIGTFLGPGQFAVLVSDAQGFASRYPGVPVAGVFGGKLSNSGEQLTLVHASGSNIVSFSYSDSAPWPAAADGSGFSLVPVNPNVNVAPGNAANWRASTAVGGSPGSDDPAPNIPRIWINEILTHTDLPQVDSIELHNPNSTNVNIRYWFLTDDRSTPFKYQFLTDTIIPAGGYLVVTETQFNANPGASNSFRLSSHGEEIYLYSGNASGQLTGFSDGFTYGAAANGVAFGRYTISTGEAQHPAQIFNTLGGNNAGPRIGPVVINEIHYAPAVGQEEFIELRNITGSPVKFYDPAAATNTWKINGVGFSFPFNAEIAGNGFALVVASDPSLFRTRHGVPSFVPIFGPYGGTLQNNGEELSLQRPDSPDVTTNGVFVPYLDVDVVRYNNNSPWPTAAAGSGASLERINSAAYSNDPINWRASPGVPSPGLDNFGNRPPTVNAGGDQSVLVPGFPATINLSGTFSDDGKPVVPGAVTLAWSQAGGPGSVVFTNSSQINATATVSGAGTYTFRLTASDGELQASDDVIVTFMRAPSSATFITTGSVWKYFDQGADRGTTWVNLNYDDSTWVSGSAPLGYGDPHIVTTVAYGTNTNNRHITTWFRKSFNIVNPSDVSNLKARYLRDDGLVVYLNGVEVFRNNMPVGVIAYTNYASSVIGGSDETNYLTATIASSLLQAGQNIVAVEVHQANASSSDLGFDLELTATTYPPNSMPVVSAGADFAITLPAPGTLAGSVNDDGLPASPGFVTYSWSKLSGPGSVTFSDTNDLHAVVSFSTNGTYALRLAASDGSLAANDDVTVTVTGQTLAAWKSSYFTVGELSNPAISGDAADPDGDTHSNLQEYVAGTNPRDGTSYLKVSGTSYTSSGNGTASIAFNAVGGRSYSILYRDTLTAGGWLSLTNISAVQTNRTMIVPDANTSVRSSRFYRILTPVP